jgi:hypothetical protein
MALLAAIIGCALPAQAAMLPPSASVGPLAHVIQTLNNCGPASVAEVLHFWGIDKTQGELQRVLRRGPALMNTDDVADYVANLGLREFIGGSGSDDVVKALVSRGFPVIVAQYVSDRDWFPHFRPIQAYDDAGRYFVASDPLLGAGYRIAYGDFDRLWTSSNGVFLVIYPPAMQQMLDDALTVSQFSGPSWMTPTSGA